MAEFTDYKNFGAITPELILQTLIGCVTLTGAKAFRVQLFNETTLTPIHCANYEDVLINIRRALAIGYDDKLVLRVNKADYYEGENIGFGECDCGVAQTVPDMVNSLFGEDANGLVYFNMANITT